MANNNLSKIISIQRSWRAIKLRRVINSRVEQYLKYGDWPTLSEAMKLHQFRTKIRLSALHHHNILYPEERLNKSATSIQRIWRGCNQRMEPWIRSGPNSRRTFQPCMDCGGTASSIKTHDDHPRCKSCQNCYDEIDTCPICLGEILSVDTCVTECGHEYHFSCLFKSLLNNTGCPLCRKSLTDVYFNTSD